MTADDAAAGGAKARVTLYAKPGCHLCEEARTELERIRAREPFELEEVDVSTDPVLFRRFGERIPVVALGEEELFEFIVAGDELLARLKAA